MGQRVNKYKRIKTKKDYDSLLSSGMFYEFYPELTGEWETDKKIIRGENE
jgi:hypothetical protein